MGKRRCKRWNDDGLAHGAKIMKWRRVQWTPRNANMLVQDAVIPKIEAGGTEP